MKRMMFLIFTIIIIQGCDLFSKDETLLAEHKQTNGNSLKIYYVGVGATANDVLQVRKEGVANPIWVSEKYNFLSSSKLLDDTSLQLILSDTGYYNKKMEFDTILIKVK